MCDGVDRRFYFLPLLQEMDHCFSTKGVFDIFDKSGRGSISIDEFRVVLQGIGWAGCGPLGARVGEAEVREQMRLTDADGNDSIDYAEFVSLIEDMESSDSEADTEDWVPMMLWSMTVFAASKDEEIAKRAFSHLDGEGKGVLNREQLRNLVRPIAEGKKSRKSFEVNNLMEATIRKFPEGINEKTFSQFCLKIIECRLVKVHVILHPGWCLTLELSDLTNFKECLPSLTRKVAVWSTSSVSVTC